jgi:hypothetical protein
MTTDAIPEGLENNNTRAAAIPSRQHRSTRLTRTGAGSHDRV